MKKLFSFVMALAMVTSLVATPKVALPNKSAKKARTELTLSAVQKQQPQVKDVAKKNIVRKAAIRKAAMASQTVIFAPVDFVDKGTSSTGSAISVTKEGVTVATDKGYGSRKYEEGVPKEQQVPEALRVYSGGELTISATSTITKIEFQVTESKYDGGLSSSYTPNATSWTETMSKQARITAITVTLGEGGDTPTPVGDTIPLTSLDAFEFGYYGSYSEEGAYNYTLVLYNSQDDNYIPQVGFDIYTEVKDEFIGNFTAEGGNLGLGYSAFYPDAESEGEYFTDASVTITEGEGDNLVVEGIFTTEAGKTYTFSVSAELYIYDAEHPYEPEDPTVLNLTAVALEEDTEYGSDGMIYAYLDMEDGSYVGLSYRAATAIQHLPEGTFSIADLEERDSYLTGYDYAGWAAGSFYEDVLGNVYYFVSGTVTVETLDGAINITINATSAHGSTITVTYSGETPQPSGDHTIVIADYQDVSFTTLDGAYMVASDANGGTAPAYNTNSEDLRLYAKNTFTLTSNNGVMTEMVFNISEKGLARQAEITPSTGTMAYDMTNAQVTWTGNASEVTFTVGEKAIHGSEGDTKAGQFDFTSIDIVEIHSNLQGIHMSESIKKFMFKGNMLINANGVLYNMQGAKLR